MDPCEQTGFHPMTKAIPPTVPASNGTGSDRRGISSAVVKRSIIRDGHKSSVSLEDQFWDALREIAEDKQVAISTLVATIDHNRTTSNLSSAIRVFVLDHFRRSDRARKEAESSASTVTTPKNRPR
jgi:predicted DNA-binding ribbon-helix-helix protein